MKLHLFHFSQLLLSETCNMAPNASVIHSYEAFVLPNATVDGFLPPLLKFAGNAFTVHGLMR